MKKFKTEPSRLIKFNKIIIPEDFILIVDTREQKPLFDNNKKSVWKNKLRIVERSLKHGDYSIEGMENKVCIERKMVSDFISYVGKDRKNTDTKCEAMKSLLWKALVIESDRDSLFIPAFGSRVTCNQVYSFLVSRAVKYNMHIYIDNDRTNIEMYVLSHLVYFYKKIRKGEI